MCDLDVLEGDDHEWRLCQLHETVGRRLAENTGSEWYTIKGQLSKGNIDIDTIVATSFGNLLSKILEFSIEFCSSSSFLLFGLEFFFVAATVLSFSVSRLIKLNVGSFSIELNIFCLFLSNHDWILEVDMDNDNQLVSTRLEEQVLDVAKENIDALVGTDGRLVSKTICMNLDFSWNSLAIHGWSNVDLSEPLGSSICGCQQYFCGYHQTYFESQPAYPARQHLPFPSFRFPVSERFSLGL